MADLYGPKAEAYSGLGERDKELEWRRKTLKATDKKNKDAYRENLFDLGQTLFIMQRYDEAEKLYKDMIKADETDMNGHFGLARIALARGNYSEALERLDKCLKFDPNYPEIYREQARAYNMLGQTANAEADFRQVLQLDTACVPGSCRQYALHFLSRPCRKLRNAKTLRQINESTDAYRRPFFSSV